MALTNKERLILNDSIDDVDSFLTDMSAVVDFNLTEYIEFKSKRIQDKYDVTSAELTVAFLEDIEAADTAAQAEYAATQYQRDRVYPSIQDQLDDIYHNGIAGWEATIKAVKDAHPKPL